MCLYFQMLETSSSWNSLPSMVKPNAKDLVDQLLKSKADMVSNPFDSPICHNLLEAAKRRKAPIQKKSPVTAVMIKSIVDQPVSQSQGSQISLLMFTRLCGVLSF